jgi:hypothetical protein
MAGAQRQARAQDRARPGGGFLSHQVRAAGAISVSL